VFLKRSGTGHKAGSSRLRRNARNTRVIRAERREAMTRYEMFKHNVRDFYIPSAKVGLFVGLVTAVAIVLLSAGCATTTKVTTPAMVESVHCLPPGVSPEFLWWYPVAASVGRLDDGIAYIVEYQPWNDPHKIVKVVWSNGQMIAWDDNPNDPNHSYWYRPDMSKCEWQLQDPGKRDT
jgi:hypothetical protein